MASSDQMRPFHCLALGYEPCLKVGENFQQLGIYMDQDCGLDLELDLVKEPAWGSVEGWCLVILQKEYWGVRGHLHSGQTVAVMVAE